MRPLRAFTLIELLTVIAIIVVLTGIAVPAAMAVRESAKHGMAADRVAALAVAMDAYRLEDPQKRFPPAEADATLRTGSGMRALDLLAPLGLAWHGEDIDRAAGGALRDPWQQPYRYRLDASMDGIADRPAAQPGWNPRSQEPWAYVWSAGRPLVAGVENGSSHATAWIHPMGTP